MTTSLVAAPVDLPAGPGASVPAPPGLPGGAVAAPVSGRPLRTARRLRVPPSVVLAAIALAVIVLAAAFPDALSPHDPLAVDPTHTLAPPSATYPLGTDENGRDVLSRIIHGTRNSLLLGFGAIAIGLVAGTVLGLLAGLGARWVDAALMRTMDVGLAFPELLLALVVIAVAGGGTRNALLAIGIASTPSYARLVRAQTLGVRRAGYVEAARATGLSESAVVLRHVLPNAVKPVLVLATIGVGTATVAGAALSFLGLGTTPPTPEWGSMLSTARNFVELSWWYGLFPGLAITVLVLSTSVLGRHLQRRAEGGLR
ncbi:ABC transporter permease [Cellulomonas aerilata]|uniref:Peptide ABC transporter permease n=1 Tax=Cellulomonas aerilata TaxID=515326 RepID=A0A512DBS7_9CELL|nr:ABC transporter permease [Cellulomonas aerilata]GEO33932.1 peptide ABC transporter permease [Cellulomonas aerilata]